MIHNYIITCIQYRKSDGYYDEESSYDSHGNMSTGKIMHQNGEEHRIMVLDE